MAETPKQGPTRGRSAQLIDDVQPFFDEHIRPRYAAFARDPLSSNAVLDCALSLSRVGEWLWHHGLSESPESAGLDAEANRDDFVRWARGECDAVALVEEIASGARPCEAADTRKVSPTSAVRRSSLPGGNFRSNRPLIAVRDDEGSYRDVESLFRDTLAFWEKLLPPASNA